MDIRKQNFTVRLTKQQKRSPRKVVLSPSLEVFKTQLENPKQLDLNSVLTLLRAGGLTVGTQAELMWEFIET